MKIIEPSFEIIEDILQEMSLAQRIEYCGRICYKSEDKITTKSADTFCQKIIEDGHNSVLEMANIHIVQEVVDVHEDFSSIEELESLKYLKVKALNDGGYIISGSIRAFGECSFLPDALRIFLEIQLPLFFGSPTELERDEFAEMFPVRFARDFEIPFSHKKIAVKLIVNRAVTHELVRHRPCSYLQESQRYCRYSQEKYGYQITYIMPWMWSNTPITECLLDDVFRSWKISCEVAEYSYMTMLEFGSSPQLARTVLPNSTKTEIICYADMDEWRHIFALRTSSAADPSMQQIMIPLQKEFEQRGWYDK